jgi:SAM-dependent methyltransferase
VETKKVFKDCRYTGVDIVEDKTKYKDGDEFRIIDLEAYIPSKVLNCKYDLIIVNHVLEHLSNGEAVINDLCSLLNNNGQIYIEWPNYKTLLRQKTKFTYHFHDDLTHKKLYGLETVGNVFLNNGLKIISLGPVSTELRNILSPALAIWNLIRGKNPGSALLHLQGKIDHVHAQLVR